MQKSTSWGHFGQSWKVSSLRKTKTNSIFSEYHFEIDDNMMAQVEQYEAMFSAFAEKIFNEFIDSDHDGAATLDEIEMVS